MIKNLPPPPTIVSGCYLSSTKKKQTWIITGERQVGKTTWCKTTARLMKSNKVTLAGIICHAQVKKNKKVGISLENIKSGEIKLLASVNKLPEYDLRVGCWYFNEAVLSWGDKCLKSAAGKEVVIFDECGPLEFVRGQGFQSGFTIFDHSLFQLGIIVIRPELLPHALERWPQAKVFCVENPTR